MAAVPLNGPVLDSIPTASGNGYYMVASDGGIFTFGDAKFYGSMGGQQPQRPGAVARARRRRVGYWLVASDGGIFAFDAAFQGSHGRHAASTSPSPAWCRYGNGYLMVAEDGGIFNFSDKAFLGSLGTTPPAQPIVSVASVDE